MKNKSFYTFFIIVAIACGLSLTSCTTTHEPSGQAYTDPDLGGDTSGNGDTTALPTSEPLYGGSPLPSRDPNANPDTADYTTLAPYHIFFSTDSYAIESSERHKVEAIAKWLADNSTAKVILAGHCDSRGTTEYNLALGERRALALRDYLVGLGADRARISTVSYGEERPAASGDNALSWTRNRRAETGILK